MTKTTTPKNLGASVRDRLRGVARERREELELVLTRYGLERMMYRLSRSRHRHDFVLKGAMLFTVWTGEPHRATRDLDLLGRGSSEIGELEAIFREVCEHPVPEDGITFDAGTLRGIRIREDREYEGVRIHVAARVDSARFTLQIDIGFGDKITPGPAPLAYPTLLDFPAPVLDAYPKESVISEKFHAMVALGIANSRMKDFYDVWAMAQTFDFEGDALARAIRGTFERRRTRLPRGQPLAFTSVFLEDQAKASQWRGFLRRANPRREGPPKLAGVVSLLSAFLLPPTEAAGRGMAFDRTWDARRVAWMAPAMGSPPPHPSPRAGLQAIEPLSLAVRSTSI